MPRIRADTIAEHKSLTRSQILRAAQGLFARWGYEQVTFAEVAEECGLGRTTLYDYFKDKHDLLASLVEETLPAAIREMMSSAPVRPPAARLRSLLASMVEFVVTEPTLGLLLHREVPKLPAAAAARVTEAHRELADELAAAYRTGVEEGDFKPLPPRLADGFLYNLIMSAARSLINSDDPQRDLPGVTEAASDLLFTGVELRRDQPPEQSDLSESEQPQPPEQEPEPPEAPEEPEQE